LDRKDSTTCAVKLPVFGNDDTTLRLVVDQVYALVSKWRFRIAGKTCDGGCALYQ
jgi:hypothetical protein